MRYLLFSNNALIELHPYLTCPNASGHARSLAAWTLNRNKHESTAPHPGRPYRTRSKSEELCLRALRHDYPVKDSASIPKVFIM
jgi:hypothetical protein